MPLRYTYDSGLISYIYDIKIYIADNYHIRRVEKDLFTSIYMEEKPLETITLSF